MTIAERFMSLFDGLPRAHGEYTVNGAKGAKQIGKAITRKAPVTAELWEKHLAGKQGIGIIPIRDDSTVMFGAIDIDCYDGFDCAALSVKIYNNDWPLVVCRSKSGGAHVYMFTNEPVPAKTLRSKLKEIAIALGHPKAELFPKQDVINGPEDIGNWINIPYFGGDSSTRYAYDNGEACSVDQFLDFAESVALSEEQLDDLTVASSGEFSDAPPCLETLITTGFPPGTMNNGLFNMAVYARMKHPDEWQRYVYEYNDRYMGPGTPGEVQQIIRSVDKKKYTYKCSESPICGVCDKRICQERKYSPLGDFSSYKTTASQKAGRPCILDEVEEVVCYSPPEDSSDEPYWVFTIHGRELDVSCDMIESQAKFKRLYLKKFHRMIQPIDEARWSRKMNMLLDKAEVADLAEDAGPEGQLWVHLESFCTGKAQARVQEELVTGKPWHSEGRIFFRSQDLFKYLEVNRFREFSERQMFAIFRRNGAKHHKFMLRGKCVACWSVPDFKQIQGELDIPNVDERPF